jgi:hypothetical protein
VRISLLSDFSPPFSRPFFRCPLDWPTAWSKPDTGSSCRCDDASGHAQYVMFTFYDLYGGPFLFPTRPPCWKGILLFFFFLKLCCSYTQNLRQLFFKSHIDNSMKSCKPTQDNRHKKEKHFMSLFFERKTTYELFSSFVFPSSLRLPLYTL